MASNASLQWRKKEIPTDKEKEERNKWLDDKEKKPHHQEMKETLEEGDADKQSSSSSTPEMGNTSEKGKASKKGGPTEKDGASEKAGTPEKGKEPEKNEPGTASGSRSTLEEGETISRGDLKRVMVDFHNTLETGNIITKSNGEALVKLLDAGYQVCICSYCFENRRGKVERQLNEQPWRDRVWKVMFTQKRVKHPEAKSSLCRVWGMKALFDDSWDILEDALSATPSGQNTKTTCGSRTMAKQKAHGILLQMLWKLSLPGKLNGSKQRPQPPEDPHKPLKEGSP